MTIPITPPALPPLISVIINSYNYGRYLEQAITSVLRQKSIDGPRFEVVVVDDGSTDETAAVLHSFSDQIIAIRQTNAGQAAAINAGVRASRGEILSFLDADDYWAEGKLAAIVAAFDADSSLSLVYHRLQPVVSDGAKTLRPIPRALCEGDLRPRMRRAAGWWPYPMTSAISVRRAAWVQAGEIPVVFRISADAWLVGIYPFLGPVAALPQSLGYYRIHSNTWHRAVDDAAMLRNRMAHWLQSLAEINRFLTMRGEPNPLSLADHLPYHLAQARLNGVSLPQRFALARHQLQFAGEPNPLRRLRDSLRLLSDLPRQGLVRSEVDTPSVSQ